MKKVFLLVIAIGVVSVSTLAQRGSLRIGIGIEAASPKGDFSNYSKMGFGGTVKALYGISNTGQVTLTSGYLTFSAKEMIKDILRADKFNNSIIPVLAGYRHYFKGFYVEPQVGYGIYKAKIKGGEFEGNDSQGAFTWAGGAGYMHKRFDVGIRYQSAENDGISVRLVSIGVGYNFLL